MREVRPQLPQLRELIVVDAEGAGERDGETTFAEVQARGHQRLMSEDGLARRYKEQAAAIDPEELATIIYTSGTTGDAKGVMLTHAAIVANLIDVDEAVHFRGDGRGALVPAAEPRLRAHHRLHVPVQGRFDQVRGIARHGRAATWSGCGRPS